MQPIRLLGIVALVDLVIVEYGGWALPTFITGRGGLTDEQKRLFRAGHAHAGTLLVLSFVCLRYLPDASLSRTWQWIAGVLLLVAIMAQSGGFFVNLTLRAIDSGTRFTRAGALGLAAALFLLCTGLAT
jgi:hypothetical protein